MPSDFIDSPFADTPVGASVHIPRGNFVGWVLEYPRTSTVAVGLTERHVSRGQVNAHCYRAYHFGRGTAARPDRRALVAQKGPLEFSTERNAPLQEPDHATNWLAIAASFWAAATLLLPNVLSGSNTVITLGPIKLNV